MPDSDLLRKQVIGKFTYLKGIVQDFQS